MGACEERGGIARVGFEGWKDRALSRGLRLFGGWGSEVGEES